MTKYVHIVYVHPVENGEPNLYKVKDEKEFKSKDLAETYIKSYNFHAVSGTLKAVYYGRVNDETGELE
jgi:hypothetical protein